VDRWALDERWRGLHGKAVHLFTLTQARDGNDDLWGEWLRTAHNLRQRWPELRYFAWLELTKRGRIHVHVIAVKVPWVKGGTPAQVIERIWGHGHVDQQVRRGQGALDSALAYGKRDSWTAASC
jgi:hypothetical protein